MMSILSASTPTLVACTTSPPSTIAQPTRQHHYRPYSPLKIRPLDSKKLLLSQSPHPQITTARTTTVTPLAHHELYDLWPQLLQTSIGSRDLALGLAIHTFLVKLGASFSTDAFQGNNLINLYVKFNRLNDAQRIFDEMPTKNTITWTTLMNGYYQLSNDVVSVFLIARDMFRSGELFNEHTCTVVLQACGYKEREGRIFGEQVHGLVIKMKFEEKVSVATSLMSMYSKCGSLDDAERVFKGLDQFDLQCFNSMILEYGKEGDAKRANEAFHTLRTLGFEPNDYTFTNVISACCNGGDVRFEVGRQLHGLATKYGYVRDTSVGNALITMYGKFGSIQEVEKLFHLNGTRNVVSWTALLSGYIKHGKEEMAISKFIQMLDFGIGFDSRCLVTVIDACSGCSHFQFGLQIHSLAVKLGYMSDAFVDTALIDCYVKFGCLAAARLIFNSVSHLNITSFNALLRGYFVNEEEDSMALFNVLRSSDTEPDSVTFALLLSLHANQASIVKGRSLHAYILKVGFESKLLVSNGIISMYSKCGSIKDACQMFFGSNERDTVSWNAMISGYALHGQGEEALFFFEKMKQEGFIPDGITILAVLQACSYSGLFEDGFNLFQVTESQYGIKPVIEHYSCMVDLLGRAGLLSKAMNFIKGSPFSRSPMLWRTLVNACKLHGDSKFGNLASKHLLDLVPEDAASYILVSNMYTEVRMLDDAAQARTMVRDKKLSKDAGCSWIEVENQVHRFVANGKDHPSSRDIYTRLDQLTAEMKEMS